MSCFITGTGTGVGKTVVIAGLAGAHLAAGKKVCVYKPVQTGAPDRTSAPDLQQVREWVDPQLPVFASYCFTDAAAPYAADPERSIQRQVLLDHFAQLRRDFDVVLVEGAGGLRVPVAPGFEMIDLMRIFSLPVWIVASPQLGTLNATLLSEEALERRCIEVAGIIISGLPPNSPDPAIRTLPETLAAFTTTDLHFLPELALSAGCLAPGSTLITHFSALLAPES